MKGGEGARAAKTSVTDDADRSVAFDPVDAFRGARLARDNALGLIEDAMALYGEGQFDSAVVLAVLAIEESLKGTELARYFRKRMDVTDGTWNRLKNHNYKLVNTYDWILEQSQSAEMREFDKKMKKEGTEPRFNGKPITLEMRIESTKKSRDLHARMQSVKEACMYQNWDRRGRCWKKIDPLELKGLACLILETAQTNFWAFLDSLDFAIDTYIRNDATLATLKEQRPTLPEIPWDADLLDGGERALRKFPAGEPTRKIRCAYGSPESGGAGGLALISPEQASAGVGLIREKAKRLYKGALSLCERGRFQNAIVLTIMSIEESLKGEYVAARAQKNQGLSGKQWDRLESHEYKLNSVDALGEMLGRSDVREFYKTRIRRRVIPAIGAKNPTKDDIKSFRARMRKLRSGLDLVKKRCLYNEWIPQYGRWDEFGHLGKAVQEDMAFCLMDMARWQLAELGLVAGRLLTGDGESCGVDPEWPWPGRDLDNPHKLLSGETVLAAILQEGLVAMCPQAVTRNIAERCMGIISDSYDDDINWHPVVKAFFMAYGSLPKNPDGEYETEADNAGQTHEGRPTMRACVRMSKDGCIGVCKKIAVNGTEFDAHDSRIDALLRVEEELAKWGGAEVSADRLEEAFAAIGVGCYWLRDEEVEDAIREVKAGVAGGWPLPAEIADDVKGATREGWEGLNPHARAYIAAAYKKKPHAAVLSRTVDSMRKSMIRDMVWHALTGWGAPRIGDAGERLRRLRAAALCYYADAWPCMGGHGFWPFWRPQCGVACPRLRCP